MVSLRNPAAIIAITALLTLCTFRSSACAQSVAPPPSRPDGLTAQAKWMPGLSSDDLNVYRDQQTLWLHPTQTSLQARRANLPRLCAPIRSLGWDGGREAELVFVPEPDHWRFAWKAAVAPEAMIKMVFDGDPVLPEKVTPARPAGDASVMLHAHHASTFGEKLRYEPQWYKNTVGYWTIPADYATWDFKLDEPGRYSIAVLQGCGEGQGGSDALISIRDGTSTVAELPFQTIDTGHFQNFRWNHLGDVTVANEGTYQLRIDAKRIAKGALFDVRAIHLVKQAK